MGKSCFIQLCLNNSKKIIEKLKNMRPTKGFLPQGLVKYHSSKTPILYIDANSNARFFQSKKCPLIVAMNNQALWFTKKDQRLLKTFQAPADSSKMIHLQKQLRKNRKRSFNNSKQGRTLVNRQGREATKVHQSKSPLQFMSCESFQFQIDMQEDQPFMRFDREEQHQDQDIYEQRSSQGIVYERNYQLRLMKISNTIVQMLLQQNQSRVALNSDQYYCTKKKMIYLGENQLLCNYTNKDVVSQLKRLSFVSYLQSICKMALNMRNQIVQNQALNNKLVFMISRQENFLRRSSNITQILSLKQKLTHLKDYKNSTCIDDLIVFIVCHLSDYRNEATYDYLVDMLAQINTFEDLCHFNSQLDKLINRGKQEPHIQYGEGSPQFIPHINQNLIGCYKIGRDRDYEIIIDRQSNVRGPMVNHNLNRSCSIYAEYQGHDYYNRVLLTHQRVVELKKINH